MHFWNDELALDDNDDDDVVVPPVPAFDTNVVLALFDFRFACNAIAKLPPLLNKLVANVTLDDVFCFLFCWLALLALHELVTCQLVDVESLCFRINPFYNEERYNKCVR